MPDPADSVSLADSISWAMLVVLETLSPAERAAFVLHDVFGLTFDEVGQALGRMPPVVASLPAGLANTSRNENHALTATQKPTARWSTPSPRRHGPDTSKALFECSIRCGTHRRRRRCRQGGARTDTRSPADRTFLAAGARQIPDLTFRVTTVNGNPAFLMVEAGRVNTVIALGIRESLVTTIDTVRNPHKFHGLRTDRAAG